MFMIATAPRRSATTLDLLAKAREWERAMMYLINTGMAAFVGPIEANIQNKKASDVVKITFPEESARTILRHLGLSA